MLQAALFCALHSLSGIRRSKLPLTALDILALRQQVAVLKRKRPRPPH
jgi:hypothetical protein